MQFNNKLNTKKQEKWPNLYEASTMQKKLMKELSFDDVDIKQSC